MNWQAGLSISESDASLFGWEGRGGPNAPYFHLPVRIAEIAGMR